MIALSKILSEQKKIPDLLFKIGNTKIKLLDTPPTSKARQIGNCKMEVVDYKYEIPYGAVANNQIYLMTSKDEATRRKQLLNLISARLKTITPFTTADFNGKAFIIKQNEISIKQWHPIKYIESARQRAHYLNGLLFLITVVEVIVRLYRNKQGEVHNYQTAEGRQSDDFPVAIAQARSLHLLLMGRITFNDFIGESVIYGQEKEQHRAKFGAVTGRETMNDLTIMFGKLLDINTAYNNMISDRPAWQGFKATFLADHKEGCLVEGRSRMYVDLAQCYGTGSESDAESEGYSSADDELEVISFMPKAPTNGK